MKKLFTFTIATLFMVNTAQAFVIEEHCDDFKTFEVSNEDACSNICPNREVTDTLSGTGEIHYSCYNSKRDKGGEYDVLDAAMDTTTVYCDSHDEAQVDPKSCIKKAIKERRDFINVFDKDYELYPDAQELCSEKNGYKLENDTCFKKCPKEKPLTGYAHDCYSCDTKYKIMLDNSRDYSTKDEEFINVCPNRVIVRGTSYINPIESINTIEKVKKIIKSEEYKNETDKHSKFYQFSLLDWSIVNNSDSEIIEYLLENDPKVGKNLTFPIRLAIDKQAPESIMKLLLERVQKEDLMMWAKHGFLYNVSLETGESWEVPMSFYAKCAGASEATQKLIKSYEKKFGIDYEPKIWEDNGTD